MPLYHYKTKSPITIYKNGDGTKEKPWYWYEKTQGQTVNLDNSSISDDNGKLYLRVKLNAGTTYYIGETGPGDGDGKIWLHDENGNELTYNDDWDGEIAGIYCRDHFEYTPDTTGIYIIGAGAYSGARGNYTVAISPAPESEPLPAPQTIYYTSEGFDEFGHSIEYNSAEDADCNNIIAPKNGLVFYASFNGNNTESAETGQDFSYYGNPTFVSVNGINCLNLTENGNSIFIEDKTNLPSGNEPFTVSAWINYVNFTEGALLYFGYANDPQQLSIWIDSNRWLGVNHYNQGFAFTTANYVETNKWYFWCETFDGTNCNGYAKSIDEKNYSVKSKQVSLNMGNSYFHFGGIRGSSNSYHAIGYISSARIYNRVLTEKEIKALSNEFKI